MDRRPSEVLQAVLGNVEKVVVGKRSELELTIVALAGQWLFACYVVVVFGVRVVADGMAGLSQVRLLHGYVAGEIHVVIARKIVHPEDLDRQFVHRRYAVIGA